VNIQTDPAITIRQLLVIDGTANGDSIVLGTGGNNGVTLSFNGTALGNILPTNGSLFALVVVFGEGANDTLDTRGWPSAACWRAGPATTPSTAAAVATCSSAAWGLTRWSPAAAATS